jgi:UDP-glucose 4-epimerase
VAAILDRLPRTGRHEVYNLGVEDYCTVDQSAGWICERLGLRPDVTYTGGERGWIGDNPFIYLATAKMRSTGWEPVHTIRQAVERTVDYLSENTWILTRQEVRT